MKESTNTIESEFKDEQELFEANAVRLAGNLEEFAGLSPAGKPIPVELGEKIETLRNFLSQKENLLVLTILLGNLGTSLWNDLALKYSGSNYEFLRDEVALRDALKGLGLEDALASFREKASKFIPKMKEVLAEGNE